MYSTNIIASDVIFHHEQHLQHVASCGVCHVAAETSASGADDLLPDKNLCGECHDVDNSETCADCHVDPDNPQRLVRIADYSPKFNHAAHAQSQIPCVRCHHVPDTAGSSLEDRILVMKGCMECHNGDRADKRCIVCHEDPEGKYPEDHRPQEWIADHVFEFSLDLGHSCTLCHTNESCQRCHLDRILLPVNGGVQ